MKVGFDPLSVVIEIVMMETSVIMISMMFYQIVVRGWLEVEYFFDDVVATDL